MNNECIGRAATAEVDGENIKLVIQDSQGFKVVRLTVEECHRLNDYAQRFRKEQIKPKYTTRDGLLFRDGVELGVGEADRVAREHGVIYAEQYVAFLEAQQKEPVTV